MTFTFPGIPGILLEACRTSNFYVSSRLTLPHRMFLWFLIRWKCLKHHSHKCNQIFNTQNTKTYQIISFFFISYWHFTSISYYMSSCFSASSLCQRVHSSASFPCKHIQDRFCIQCICTNNEVYEKQNACAQIMKQMCDIYLP